MYPSDDSIGVIFPIKYLHIKPGIWLIGVICELGWKCQILHFSISDILLEAEASRVLMIEAVYQYFDVILVFCGSGWAPFYEYGVLDIYGVAIVVLLLDSAWIF